MEEALVSLFGEDVDVGQSTGQTPADTEEPSDTGDAGDAGDTPSMSVEDYIRAAADAYDNAQDALKDGDWAKYGQYMDELKASLDALTE